MLGIGKENYREMADFWGANHAWSESLQELIDLIERFRAKLYCQNPEKWKYFALCIAAIEQVPELAELYEINENAHYWDDRVKRKPRKTEPPQVNLRPLACYPNVLPKCYDTSGQDFGGLYFMGATYFNPISLNPIYAVKVGLSYSDIGRRIQDYGTYNPFIYHERAHVLPFSACDEASEKMCHSFLSSISIQQMDKESEWYIVDEQTYLYLCENMKRVSFFAGVATGKIRAI